MRSAKRFVTALFLLVLCVTLMVVSAYATEEIASGTCGENLAWVLDDAGTLTISGTGEMTEFNFTERAPWDSYAASIQRVVISEGVANIAGYSFYDCRNLTDVEIPDGITSIGRGAFYNCTALRTVTIPEGVTTIAESAFRACVDLTSITISESVTEIGNYAFSHCDALTSVTIPKSVSSIGDHAFSSCDNLISAVIHADITAIGGSLFLDCSKLETIEIPDGVTNIGEHAFAFCVSLTSVTIPKSVASIDEYAFNNCSSLSDVYYGGSVRTWNNIKFGNSDSELRTAAIHYAVPTGELTWELKDGNTLVISGIGEMNDYRYDIIDGHIKAPWWGHESVVESIVIEEGVVSVGNYAFYPFQNVTSVMIPSSMEYFGWYAFAQFGVQDVYYGGSMIDWIRLGEPDIGEEVHCALPSKPTDVAFSGTCGENLTWTLDLRGVLTISGTGNMNDFYGTVRLCSRPSFVNAIVIEEGVTSIGEWAFADYTGVTTVVLPKSLVEIEMVAFTRCHYLTDVYYAGSTEDWTGITIGSNNEKLTDATIHYDTNDLCLHGYEAVVTAPTCTEVGYTTCTCTICGDSYVADEVAALGHSYESVITAPTYTSGGYTTHTCSNCGDSYVDSHTAPLLLDTPVISEFENTASGVKITWGAVEGAEAYRVFAKTSKGWMTLGTTTDTSFVWTGANSGLTYTFTVRCMNAAGTAFTSDYNTTGWRHTYDDQPVITKLQNTANGIKITWDAVKGAGKYRVYAKTRNGWLNLGTTASTSFLYTGAKPGLTYTFTVRALNAAGTAFVSSFNPTGWRQTYAIEPNITQFQNTANGIKITWESVAGAGKYRVYAKTRNGWLNLGTTTATSFVYTGAKSGLTYTFTVRALNAAGNAFVSSFSPTGWKHTYISQPTVTKFENVSNGIKITWGKVNGAAAYRVFAKTSKGWVAVGTTTGTSFVWTGAKSGLTYTFTVRCLNTEGTAYTSSYNTVGWRQKYIAQPADVKLSEADNGVQITWGAVSGAERYRVYMNTAKGWSCVGHTTGTSFVWTDAQKGETYTFTVRCVNAANDAFTSSYDTTGWTIWYGIYDPENPGDTDSGWGDIS